MCRGGSASAAASAPRLSSFAGVVLSACPSRAVDDEEARFLLFSGRDIWRNGAFAHGGLLFAPAAARPGRFSPQAGAVGRPLSLRRQQSSAVSRCIGVETTAQVLPGWRIKRGNLEVKFFFGPDIQQHRLWPDDPANSLRGHSFGLRMATELWYEPTPATMLAADASLSSIATSNSARIAYGWHALDQVLCRTRNRGLSAPTAIGSCGSAFTSPR